MAACLIADSPADSPAEQAGTLDFDDPKGVKLGTSGIKAYGRAKLMLLLFTYELQRRLRLAGAPVEAFPVHPGHTEWQLCSLLMRACSTCVLAIC